MLYEVITFEVFHREPGRTVFWHLDETYLGATTEIHQMETRPPRGEHTLTVMDDQGAIIQRRFTVLSE